MNLILVNKQDKSIGSATKLNAHLGDGSLHRAFTCVVQNDQSQFLFTRRSLQKPLWPTFWDLSFSSHPVVDEDIAKSVVKRAKQELNLQITPPQFLFSQYYQAKWNEFFSEHEFNHYFLAQIKSKFIPNPNEISEATWIDSAKILDFISQNKSEIAPWVKFVLKKLPNIIK